MNTNDADNTVGSQSPASPRAAGTGLRCQEIGRAYVRYLNDGRIGRIVGTSDERTIVAFGTTVVHLLAWEFEVLP